MENVGIFYGSLGYTTTILYIFWPFGILRVIWYILTPFWYIVSRKIWQPCLYLETYCFRFPQEVVF
jgi:hypothetical protein